MSDTFTGEALSRLYTTIYAYINEDFITSGGIVSPGKLDKAKIQAIINNTAQYIGAFNSLLENYSGTTIFGAEFSLINREDENAIMPRGILLVPGSFKSSTNFMLTLQYEIGQNDLYLAREELNKYCEYFSELELSVKRPELDFNTGKSDGLRILNRFSNRFAHKCYGIIVEKEWKRKFREAESKEMKLDRIDIKSDISANGSEMINYSEFPPKTKLTNVKVNPIYLKAKEGIKASYLFLRFCITPESIKKIITSSVDFGNQLFLPLNESSGNYIQQSLLNIFLDYFQDMINGFDIERPPSFLTSMLNEEILVYKDGLAFFENKLTEYFNSGEKATFEKHFENLESLIIRAGQEQSLLKQILGVFKNYLYDTFQEDEDFEKKEFPTWEFRGETTYFIMYGNLAIKNILEGLPIYLSNLCEKELTINYIDTFINKTMSDKEDPVKELARTYMNKFKDWIFNKINQKYLTKKVENIDETDIEDSFPRELGRYLEEFIENESLTTQDLIAFACNFIEPRIEIEEHQKIFQKVKKKLEAYPNEIEFITDYLLRYNVFNLFLEEHHKDLTFPGRADEFIVTYFEFIKKRMSLELQWIDLIEEWMIEFGQDNIDRNREIYEQINNFINYILILKDKEVKKESFLINIEKFYEGKDEIIDALLELFKDIFQQSIEMQKTFPDFLLNSFTDHILDNEINLKLKLPKEFLLLESEETFKRYIENLEIKAYSKLIVKPSLLLLQNVKHPDLLTQVKFSYAGEKLNKMTVSIGSNFEEIKGKILF